MLWSTSVYNTQMKNKHEISFSEDFRTDVKNERYLMLFKYMKSNESMSPNFLYVVCQIPASFRRRQNL